MTGPVRVRAVAVPLKTYYRMDAVLPEDVAGDHRPKVDPGEQDAA